MELKEIEQEIKKKELELDTLLKQKVEIEKSIENNLEQYNDKFFLCDGFTGKAYYHITKALTITKGLIQCEGECFSNLSTMQTISQNYSVGLLYFNPSSAKEIEPNVFYKQLRIIRSHINDMYSKGKICENCKYYSDVNMACMNPIMEGARELPYSSMCVNNEVKDK